MTAAEYEARSEWLIAALRAQDFDAPEFHALQIEIARRWAKDRAARAQAPEVAPVAWIDPEWLERTPDKPYRKPFSPVITYPQREWTPLYAAPVAQQQTTVDAVGAPSVAAARDAALKKRVSEILAAALGGRDNRYRFETSYIRWGLVEKDIHAAIDAAANLPALPPSAGQNISNAVAVPVEVADVCDAIVDAVAAIRDPDFDCPMDLGCPCAAACLEPAECSPISCPTCGIGHIGPAAKELSAKLAVPVEVAAAIERVRAFADNIHSRHPLDVTLRRALDTVCAAASRAPAAAIELTDAQIIDMAVQAADELDATRVHEMRGTDWHATTIFDGDAGLLRFGRLAAVASRAVGPPREPTQAMIRAGACALYGEPNQLGLDAFETALRAALDTAEAAPGAEP